MKDLVSELEACGTPEALIDAHLSGWFNLDSAELYRGFAIGEHDTVLDVGCGDGGYAAFCQRFSDKVTCLDLDELRLRYTRDRLAASGHYPIDAVVSEAVPLPFGDGTMSRIICTEVLEHVETPEAVLHELNRVGAPGALYLITVPDSLCEDLQSRVAPPVYFEHPNHIRVFTPDDFLRAVEDAGLAVLDHRRFSFYQTMWLTLFWACGCDISDRSHPLLKSWDRTWGLLMNSAQGATAKERLDRILPKTQLVLAQKVS